jgi:hypothetical protein
MEAFTPLGGPPRDGRQFRGEKDQSGHPNTETTLTLLVRRNGYFVWLQRDGRWCGFRHQAEKTSLVGD